jgi:hypothetical protein
MEVTKALQAIQDQNNNSGLTLMKPSRPSLAVLSEDHPKIKNIVDKSETDGMINYLLTILNIKVGSKEEADDLKVQMLVVNDFIKTKFGHLTVPEVREAFKMYVAKEFPELKDFRLLDCIAAGEILNAFTNYRSDALRVYNFKKSKFQNQLPDITESQKDDIVKNGVNEVFKEYKKTKIMPEINEYIFDFLIQKGLIKNGNNPKQIEYFQTKQREASSLVKKELTKIVHSGNDAEKKQAKADLELLQKGDQRKIIIKAKEIVLVDFFNKQIDFERQAIF